ncbi:TPA: DUF551 domain-containing protein [Escherichia coli]|nr:DUF551 domain-containing protein [Escherichia coli]HCN6908484.1 DUF551 domain-containing protein [Escherichia coli]HCN9115323.1 DUF551 domain-containing protein [Escherichia coli]
MTTITRENAEIKSFITGFLSDPAHDNQSSSSLLANVFRIALASLEAEPVAWMRDDADGREYNARNEFSGGGGGVPLYATPPVPVVPEEISTTHTMLPAMSDQLMAFGYVKGWNACRAAMLHAGNFRKNANSSTNNFREIAETSTNSPVIPGEVLSAILKFARVRADFDDFDGDRRGIGDCLDEAEQELIVTINKYASQLAAEPIATNDVREQQTAVPPVPEIQADVAQAIENLKQKLVECNRYNYCADAVKGVEDACHAAMLQGIQPVSQTYKLPVNTPCQDAPAHIWLQTAGVWPEDGELSELTWCSHNQHHDDTLYVRADLVNGNHPVTPDGWISCSERMPEKNQNVLISVNFDSSLVEPLICSARYTGITFRRGDVTIKPGNGIEQATHWMPLPEPPQESKSE